MHRLNHNRSSFGIFIVVFIIFLLAGGVYIGRMFLLKSHSPGIIRNVPGPNPTDTANPKNLIITELDDGKSFPVTKSTHILMQLSNKPNVWDMPTSQDAVKIVPIHYFQDPGFKEWEITPLTIGTIALRSHGMANCSKKASACPDYAINFQVKLIVGQ